jgi:branched-chain amino acid transport system permease protein
MIVKSAIENMEVIGGARGFLGISKLTTLPVVFVWTAAALWLARNLVFSNLGRGALAIREDETTAEIMGVDTRRVKLLVFLVSAFLAGVAGGLYAHLLQFINPRSFDILKSTEMLVMVYLGGIGSISGSILGATVYTALLELLRPLGVWRMVLMPLLLVLLMILRPRGIMGLREVRWLRPRDPGPDAELQARGEA